MKLILSLFFFVISSFALAHSGGTNGDGCHTNRKTGDYHCHNRKVSKALQAQYCHITGGQARCGYALSSCEDLVQDFGGYCERN